MVRSAAATVLLMVLASVPAQAQVVEDAQQFDPFEARYGKPVDVDIHDLVFNPESYRDKAVRVRGTLERDTSTTEAYVLRSSFGDRARILPINEIALEFEDTARANLGEEFQVTGLVYVAGRTSGSVSGQASQPGSPLVTIQFWKFNVRLRRERPGAQGVLVPLETLVQKPGRYDGKLVRVVGQFRGHNLFGDLPARSSTESNDWVLKDELFAVWISGKKPKGDGFALDPKLKRDTGRWLDVTGRVEVAGAVVRIRASSVALTGPKVVVAKESRPPPAPPTPRAKRLPLIVFSLPLDGETDVPAVGRFYIQFNNDMDEESFRDRVLFRYVGARRVGDREFVGLKFTYDAGRRTLGLDPGDALRPGREVEIVLLSGIRDIDGQELVARPGWEVPPGVAEALRFRVARSVGGGN